VSSARRRLGDLARNGPARGPLRAARRRLLDTRLWVPRLHSYAPQSMLRTEQHRPQSATVGAVDAHNHLGRWLSDGWMVPDVGRLVAALERLNVEAVVNLDGRWDAELEANLDRYDRAHPGRFATFCHVDWAEAVRPGFGDRLAASVRRSAAAGAAGLKVWKDLGLSVLDDHGVLLLMDDERLAPLWATAAELGLPVLVHTGDPAAFFRPVDRHNERLEELLRNPGFSLHGKPVPTLERLLDAFEATALAHPDTIFIGAHVAGAAEDLEWVRRLLDACPNVMIDLGARIAELGRQPRAARDLIVAHTDRVLFGSDVFPPRPEEYQIWFRFLETADECFSYSTAEVPPSGRWTVSGLDLPADVLAAVYAGNARRIIPRLARS